MNIGIVFGLDCPAASDGGGLRSGLGAPLAALGQYVSYYAWGDTLPEGIDLLIGHSYGGETCVKYGNTHPQTKLILLDPVPQNWWILWFKLHSFSTKATWVDTYLRASHGWLPFPSQKCFGPDYCVNQVFPGVGHNDMRGCVPLHDEIISTITKLGAK